MNGCSVSNDIGGPEEVAGLEEADATEIERDQPGELVDHDDPTRDGGGYGILLLDTTSSMNAVRPSTGNTRCDDAKTMARGMILDFFDPAKTDGDGIAIWGFTNNPQSNDDVQPLTTGYYTDSASAIAALTSLPACAGDTPLADALCKGTNGDGETFTIDPMVDHLMILTDGFEDNSDGPCSGPSGDPTTPGTWQYLVSEEMGSTGVRVDIRYWIDPTLLLMEKSIDSLASNDEAYDPSVEEIMLVADIEELPQDRVDQMLADNQSQQTQKLPMDVDKDVQTTCGLACLELHAAKHWALSTGGTWGAVEDNNGAYPLEDTTDPVGGPVHPVLPALAPVEMELEGVHHEL